MPSETTTPGVKREKDVQRESRDDIMPLYNVVLLDDNEHTYEYVIEMLQKLFAYSAPDAFQHAVEVDKTGRTVVITCELLKPNSAASRSTATAPTLGWPSPRDPCPQLWNLPPPDYVHPLVSRVNLGSTPEDCLLKGSSDGDPYVS